jgi:hypothetical protein
MSFFKWATQDFKGTSYEKGKLLEDYVEFVYQILLKLEANGNDEPVLVSRNVKFFKNDIVNEFDVYYEFKKAGVIHRVAIECKNHDEPINISHIRNFSFKLNEFHNITGVFVSQTGYQTGAKALAKEKGILALTTEELPELNQVIGLTLKNIYLPNEYVKGEPFYLLMEEINNELTGYCEITHLGDGPGAIVLFLSRSMGERYISMYNVKNHAVRGLKQEAFDIYIRCAINEGAKFQIITYLGHNKEDNLSFYLEPEDLRKQYFDM